MIPGMIARFVVGAGVLGSLLAGCASTTPSSLAPPVASGRAPALLCNLDSLRWTHDFVARADARDCVGLLESVRIGN